MAKHILHDQAIRMRLEGMSYSQIKRELGMSKSTLSKWLAPYPLSLERMRELREPNEARVERCRATKQAKRDARHTVVYEEARKRIQSLSDRETFISGLFLYWAEGTKGSRDCICMTNTDPTMIIFFLRWLDVVGVAKEKIKVRLQIYEDMDDVHYKAFWSGALDIPLSQFRNSYVKKTATNKRLNYKGRFGHGTCEVFVNNRDLYELVRFGISYIRDQYGGIDFPNTRGV